MKEGAKTISSWDVVLTTEDGEKLEVSKLFQFDIPDGITGDMDEVIEIWAREHGYNIGWV